MRVSGRNSLTVPLRFLVRAGASGNAGICGIQLVDERGEVARSCSRLPTVGVFGGGGAGVKPPCAAMVSRPAHAEWDHRTTRDVDQVIGAFSWCDEMYFSSWVDSTSVSTSIMRRWIFPCVPERPVGEPSTWPTPGPTIAAAGPPSRPRAAGCSTRSQPSSLRGEAFLEAGRRPDRGRDAAGRAVDPFGLGRPSARAP